MVHWGNVIPGGVHEVRYEALVQEPERVIRDLVGYIGLDWNPACLAFHRTNRRIRTTSHEQIRKPLYTDSIGRWKNYQQFLAGFDDGLIEYGGGYNSPPNER